MKWISYRNCTKYEGMHIDYISFYKKIKQINV